MKVVLFCGGLGTRLREHSDGVPKPMVTVGYRPILWHVMNYYAHYGHKDFILCLGYRADLIKEYFLNYSECTSNDFVFANGGKKLSLLSSDIDDWKITFVDTGLCSNIGQRLAAVREYVADEPLFLANYTDGVTDMPLPAMIDACSARPVTASFICIKMQQAFHVVSLAVDGTVESVRSAGESDIWINGGFFLFKNEIFDYVCAGEELVEEPFQRLIEKKQLLAYKYEGFWACMDTFKDKQRLDNYYMSGQAPWEVWKKARNDRRKGPAFQVAANSA
jgi:glucose-1-phosphate cytidylyltransferase